MIALMLITIASGLTLGTGRTIPTVAAVMGLIGVVIGGLVIARPKMAGFGSPASLLLGFLSLAVGGLHAAFAVGGVGTGNGLAGAIIAVALGVIAIVIGALGYARSRRTA